MKEKIKDFIDWMQYATMYKFIHTTDGSCISVETLSKLIDIWEREE